MVEPFLNRHDFNSIVGGVVHENPMAAHGQVMVSVPQHLLHPHVRRAEFRLEAKAVTRRLSFEHEQPVAVQRSTRRSMTANPLRSGTSHKS